MEHSVPQKNYRARKYFSRTGVVAVHPSTLKRLNERAETLILWNPIYEHVAVCCKKSYPFFASIKIC